MTGTTGGNFMNNFGKVEYITDSYVGTARYTGRGHRKGNDRGDWNAREFIAWDGEGITYDALIDVGNGFYHKHGAKHANKMNYEAVAQSYVLLANSKGGHITHKDGLSTKRCLDFLLDTKKQYPKSIFVGFSFNYDINQMLKDLPETALWRLHETNKTRYYGYSIKWYPRKYFMVSHRKTKRAMILYDVFSFFQSSFLKTCKKFLGEDDPQLDLIQRGKEARELFTWEELDEFIIPYCDTELSMLVRVMDILREQFHSVGIDPGRWHGPGAVANKVLRKYNIIISRESPTEVLDASQFAYAGGRFEPFALGRHPNTVWEYDINSAYPEAITQLPDISKGRWEYVVGFQPGTFGVWNIDYRTGDGAWYETDRPQPLFCRSGSGSISYPCEVQGWYWTPEAELVPDSVIDGWVFREDEGTRPFTFVKEMYANRRLLIHQKDPTERALKLILNSLYGKLAQTVGGRNGPPTWHQLEYAGFITSFTRAKLFNAVKLNPSAIIAVETDALFSTEPLDLPLSENLGDWKEDVFDEIVYLQSGVYYAKDGDEIISKYRGMDKDKFTNQPLDLPYDEVVEHLFKWTGFKPGARAQPLVSYTTRFVGLGLGLRTKSVWRSWEKKSRVISLDQKVIGTAQKRNHNSPDCPMCLSGISMGECLHPTTIGGHAGKSYARNIPWRTIAGGVEVNWEEWKKENSDLDRWQ